MDKAGIAVVALCILAALPWTLSYQGWALAAFALAPPVVFGVAVALKGGRKRGRMAVGA